MFRTADGAGVKKLFLTGYTPSPRDDFNQYRKDFSKVSLGAEKTVQWEKVYSLGSLIKKLRADGYTIIAVEQSKKSIPYYKLNAKRPTLDATVFIFGNEVSGLTRHILKMCDHSIEIPMRGATIRSATHPRHSGKGKESLNVSVSFGIIMYYWALVIK